MTVKAKTLRKLATLSMCDIGDPLLWLSGKVSVKEMKNHKRSRVNYPGV
jgi:hypothetical protein